MRSALTHAKLSLLTSAGTSVLVLVLFHFHDTYLIIDRYGQSSLELGFKYLWVPVVLVLFWVTGNGYALALAIRALRQAGAEPDQHRKRLMRTLALLGISLPLVWPVSLLVTYVLMHFHA